MIIAPGALRHWFVGTEALLFLLNVALASCVICGLGLLAARSCRHRPEPLRHSFLVSALLLMVASPMLFWLAGALGWGFSVPLATAIVDGQLGNSTSPLLEARSNSHRAPTPDRHSENEFGLVPVSDAELPMMALQVGTMLLIVWGIGTAVLIVKFVGGLVTLARLRATFSTAGDSALTQAATESFRLIGIRQRVELHHTPLALTPFSMGLIRPRVVLPAGLAGCLDAQQLRYVLLHEAAHILRRDHWVALLQYVCSALFWWNPLLRVVNARLARLREQICDDYVVDAGGDGRAFAEALVRVAEWGTARPNVFCSAALLDDRRDSRDCDELEQRIVRLVCRRKPRELRMGRASRATVAACGLLLAAALPIAGLRAADSAEEVSTGHQRSGLATPGTKGDLADQWLMHLPRGFVHQVTLTPLGADRYRLEPQKLNSSGVYEVQAGRLVMVEPNDRRLLGFQWEIHVDGHLTLVGQPPLRETGSNYLGATMVPVIK